MARFWLHRIIPKGIWALFRGLLFVVTWVYGSLHVGWGLGRLVSVFSQTQWQWSWTGCSKFLKPCPLKLPKLGTGWSNIISPCPPPNNRPTLCSPRHSKNSACWLVSRGEWKPDFYLGHWTILDSVQVMTLGLTLQTVYGMRDCVPQLPQWSRLGTAVPHSTRYGKWLRRGAASARDFSQISL